MWRALGRRAPSVPFRFSLVIWAALALLWGQAAGAGDLDAVAPAAEVKYAQARTATADAIELGSRIYRRKGCAACHSLDGTRKQGPTWKGLYGSKREFTTGQVVIADDEYLRRSIFKPRAQVVKGFPRSLMPKDLRRKLSDEQVEAIIELIKSVR